MQKLVPQHLGVYVPLHKAYLIHYFMQVDELHAEAACGETFDNETFNNSYQSKPYISNLDSRLCKKCLCQYFKSRKNLQDFKR